MSDLRRLSDTLGRGAWIRAGIVAALLVLLVVSHSWRNSKVEDARRAEAQRGWLQAQLPRIEAARANRPHVPAHPEPGTSLVALVSGRAKGFELPVARAETEVDGAVSLTLTEARYEHTLGWLEALVSENGLQIERLSLQRTKTPGLVDVQARVRVPPDGNHFSPK
jgi:type II secretory pathway component PulM